MKEMLYYTRAIYGDPEKEAVRKVLDNEWLSGGEQTIKFEEELAEWWGVKHALSCNSGSSANFIALQALNLEEGSEIITPAGGAFPTTISPMVYLKHIPVFVDIDLDNLCLDLKEVEKELAPLESDHDLVPIRVHDNGNIATANIKAIVFAHTLGFMPDMGRLMSIAKHYDLKVIEDTCDAMGSEQNGKKAGTFGDLATVSFYPAHLMTTGGEGGAILTNDTKLYWEAHRIRDWGRDCRCQWGKPQPACKDRWGKPPFDHRYYYTSIGLNLKMTEMQAAFGREQLKRVDGFINKRKRNYWILASELGMIPKYKDITPFAYPFFHPERDKAMRFLEENGIQTRTLFAGNILEHPAFKDIECRVVGDLKNSQKLLRDAFFVGVGPHLEAKDMFYIADKLKELE